MHIFEHLIPTQGPIPLECMSMRKTKIICTQGPAVDSDEMVEKLILNGMDAARFNFSHGSHEEHKARMDRVKRVAAKLGRHIPLILDTKGPEIRVGTFTDGPVMLEEGQSFTLYSDPSHPGDQEGVGVSYPYLSEDVEKGNVILIDDGLVCLTVTSVVGPDIVCRVDNPGRVSNHKSINIPSVNIDQPYISDKDREDILFGIENDVDFIAASFMRSADDARKLRKLLNVNGGEKIRIIAKIENASGVENLDQIIEIVDGVMVARGDMGVEIPFRELPSIQKELIRKCYNKGKIVVTATQMLESMSEHPRPTRAEVSDVANAIYDGTTCLMLSGETAAGKYPIAAVKTMSEIASFTETKIDYGKRFADKHLKLNADIMNTVASAAVEASFFLGLKAIVCMTVSGRTAQVVSYYRPACPIIACVTDEKAARQLNLSYGVHPVMASLIEDMDFMKALAIKLALSTSMVKEGDLVALITGSTTGGSYYSDCLQITTL